MLERTAVDARIREVGLVKAANERKVAAILFTYRCTASCRHCLFGCRGARPDVVMKPERCVRYLGQLHELGRVVHIAGGEPMMYWHELARSLDLAGERGCSPHFIETNCSFAGNDGIVRERFVFLKEHGLAGVLLSADPYHQEFVPPENFIRARRLAREVFGRENVWSTDATDEEVGGYPEIARNEARLAEHVRAHPPRLVGTAQMEVARFLEPVALEELPPENGWTPGRRSRRCAAEFDGGTMWEIHVDPYGNIQTNCGVILGKADRTTVAELMSRGLSGVNFISGVLSAEGPLGLAEFARTEHGFEVPRSARQKCELCYLTRRFLRSFYPDILGPAEVYP